MAGVAGVHAHRILVEELGARPTSLTNCVPSENFGGGHPDPYRVYIHFVS
jgi:phosphoglucomutase